MGTIQLTLWGPTFSTTYILETTRKFPLMPRSSVSRLTLSHHHTLTSSHPHTVMPIHRTVTPVFRFMSSNGKWVWIHGEGVLHYKEDGVKLQFWEIKAKLARCGVCVCGGGVVRRVNLSSSSHDHQHTAIGMNTQVQCMWSILRRVLGPGTLTRPSYTHTRLATPTEWATPSSREVVVCSHIVLLYSRYCVKLCTCNWTR